MAVLAGGEDIWVAVYGVFYLCVVLHRYRVLRPYICSPLGVGFVLGQGVSCLLFGQVSSIFLYLGLCGVVPQLSSPDAENRSPDNQKRRSDTERRSPHTRNISPDTQV